MRKQIHLEVSGSQTPRERVWSAIRELKKFTVYKVARRANVDDLTVKTYVRSLELAGFIKATFKPGGGGGKSPVPTARTESQFELLKDIGIHAPRLKKDGTPVTQGIGRENMWRTMKIVRQFSPRELAVHASTDEHQVKENEAADYIKHLARAGYLVLVKEADRRSASQAVYRFVLSKNTGPKPPMVQRVKQVYDPNIAKIVYAPDPSEVDE